MKKFLVTISVLGLAAALRTPVYAMESMDQMPATHNESMQMSQHEPTSEPANASDASDSKTAVPEQTSHEDAHTASISSTTTTTTSVTATESNHNHDSTNQPAANAPAAALAATDHSHDNAVSSNGQTGSEHSHQTAEKLPVTGFSPVGVFIVVALGASLWHFIYSTLLQRYGAQKSTR